jgi:hypothetical protein
MKTLRTFCDVSVQARSKLKVSSERTPEGYLVAEVNATRPGIFEYVDERGVVLRVLRPRDQVFDKESMDSLRNKPATFDHPENEILPDSTNIQKYMVGAVHDQVEEVDDFVRTKLTVYRKDAIDAIDAGNDEVSCGYKAVFEECPGSVDPEFGPYDLKQTNIRYNHLAVGIDEGRGGPSVRILLDSKTATIKGENPMGKKFKLGDKDFDVPEDLHDALSKHFSDKDTEMLGMKALADKYKIDSEGLAKELDKMKKAKDSMDDEEGEEADDAAEAEEKDCKDSAGSLLNLETLRPHTSVGKRIKTAFIRLHSTIKAEKEKTVKAVTDSADPNKLAEAAQERAKLVGVALNVLDKADAQKLFRTNADDIKKQVIAAKNPKLTAEVIAAKSAEWRDGMYESIANSIDFNMGETLGAMFMPPAETRQTVPGPGNGRQQRAPWVKPSLSHSRALTKK